MRIEISPDDRKLADDLAEDILAGVKKSFAKGDTRRAAHNKTLGVLKASFEILPDLPARCRVGLFSQARKYETWIRCSSSNAASRSDKIRDARGFSMKLTGVEGERFETKKGESSTQDFVMMSAEAFPFGSLKIFARATRLVIKHGYGAMGAYLLFTGKFRIMWMLWKAFRKQANLLTQQYWSMMPYRFGKEIVKFTLIPTTSGLSPKPDKLSGAYLSKNLEVDLSKQGASFDFYLQFFEDEEATPLHNEQKKWNLNASPLFKVATLTIPQQKVGSQERFLFAENLSYSPANSLKEHAPIGALNHARVVAYELISDYRHEANGVERYEPTADDFVRIR